MTTSLDQWDNGPDVPPDATTDRLIKHEWRWHEDDPDDECPACRVDRGAALLDERRPGWWEDVDVRTLDMGGCWSCVLGQVFGEYHDGTEWLGVPADTWSVQWLGFEGSEQDYDVLTILWRAAINRRRHAES